MLTCLYDTSDVIGPRFKVTFGRLTSARARADSGVSSAGLTTTVQPAARAAPTFLVIMALGKFHCGTTSINHLSIPYHVI